MNLRSTVLVVLVGVGLGCGTAESPDAIPDHCNPLSATGCAFPFPSSAYLADDVSTATGYRLDLIEEALPLNTRGDATEPEKWNVLDGFAAGGVILASFPHGVSPDSFPLNTEPEAYLAADAPVVLIDLSTDERVPIFAEADMNADEAENRALLVHPLERLKPATRYGVVVRNTVQDANGKALTRSRGFDALMRGRTMDHPLFERVAAHHSEVIAAAQAEGVTPDEIVLAWDFVTASKEAMTADLRAMQQQAIAQLDADPMAIPFSLSERPADPATTYKLYVGSYEAPNFLATDSHGSVLSRDSDGVPVIDGTYEANVSIVVPACVQTAALPVPVVVFGHGLFGSGEGYLDDDRLQGIANDHCFVLVATDWIGLSEFDVLNVIAVANDYNAVHSIPDKLSQSVINFITLQYLARGPLAAAPELEFNTTNVIDPAQVYYFGASLGGIMGGVYMSYENTIPRGVLGVPGGSWTLLLERSFAWGQFESTIKAAYETDEAYQLGIALLGTTFERVDPLTTARNVIDDPLPGANAKRLLLYEAVGDSLVSNLATETLARTMGVPALTPSSVYTPFGLDESNAPANALVVYDEGVATGNEGLTNQPPTNDNGTHGDINVKRAVIDQMRSFLIDGTVVNTCTVGQGEVMCDCTTGACD